jgi:magnesium-transporting ATPase (P-type)
MSAGAAAATLVRGIAMHHLSIHEAVVLLESDRGRGLSSDEAAGRLQRHGPNVLPRVERRSALLRLLLQFHHPLIYVLLVAAAVTYVVGEPVDASVIVGVVLANAAIGFVQEARAERALDALAAMMTVDAHVIRDGTKRRVPAKELVPTNLGEGLLILVAILAGATLPILPVQILWINMTTAVLLGLTLAFERVEPGIMTRPPRRPSEPLLTRDVVARILLVSGLLLTASFWLFEHELGRGMPVAESRTAAVNVFVAVELFYLLNCRSLTGHAADLGLFSNRWLLGGAGLMVALQLALTYWSPMNQLFDTAPIGAVTWLKIVGAAAVTWIVVEIEKAIRRRAARRQPRRHPSAEPVQGAA